MRILHTMNMKVPISGIINQMSFEKSAAQSIGLNWETKIFTIKDRNSDLLVSWQGDGSKRIKFKKAYYHWLRTMMNKFDILLLRYSPFDYFQYEFISKIKKPVFLVFHTKNIDELRLNHGIVATVKANLEQLLGPFSIRSAYGIISVTEEIGRNEIARTQINREPIIYPNGILFEDPMIYYDARLREIPELVFMASKFAAWHGLDLLIESIRKSSLKFRIHLIGELDQKTLVYVKSDSRYIVHGTLQSKDAEKILASSWIGITSLAHFRLNMAQACPLKTREYLRFGLPVYGSYREVFPENMPFYRQGPCDITNILSYAQEMRSYSRSEVSTVVRSYIDKIVLLQNLYNAICNATLSCSE